MTLGKWQFTATGDGLPDEDVQAIIDLLYALYNAESVCVHNSILGFASIFGGMSGLVSELLVAVVAPGTPASAAAAASLAELIELDKTLNHRVAKSRSKSKFKSEGGAK